VYHHLQRRSGDGVVRRGCVRTALQSGRRRLQTTTRLTECEADTYSSMTELRWMRHGVHGNERKRGCTAGVCALTGCNTGFKYCDLMPSTAAR